MCLEAFSEELREMAQKNLAVLLVLCFLVLSWVGGESLAAPSLHEACACGDVGQVLEFLAAGRNPNEREAWDRTPLFCTVEAGLNAPLSMHLRVVEELVKAGADVNVLCRASNGSDLAPLHVTLLKGALFEELTWLLLTSGASVNLAGDEGPPLILAARCEASVSQLKMLLDSGADIRVKDKKGRSALAVVVESSSPSLEKARYLLDAGADPNEIFCDDAGREKTVLMAAASNGKPDLIRLLLDRGALLRLTCREGLTAFDFAVSAGRQENAALLR